MEHEQPDDRPKGGKITGNQSLTSNNIRFKRATALSEEEEEEESN